MTSSRPAGQGLRRAQVEGALRGYHCDLFFGGVLSESDALVFGRGAAGRLNQLVHGAERGEVVESHIDLVAYARKHDSLEAWEELC